MVYKTRAGCVSCVMSEMSDTCVFYPSDLGKRRDRNPGRFEVPMERTTRRTCRLSADVMVRVRKSFCAFALKKRALRELCITGDEPSTDVEKQKQMELIDTTIERIKRRDRFALGAINAVECRKQDDLQDLIDSLDCWSFGLNEPQVLELLEVEPKH